MRIVSKAVFKASKSACVDIDFEEIACNSAFDNRATNKFTCEAKFYAAIIPDKFSASLKSRNYSDIGRIITLSLVCLSLVIVVADSYCASFENTADAIPRYRWSSRFKGNSVKFNEFVQTHVELIPSNCSINAALCASVHCEINAVS